VPSGDGKVIILSDSDEEEEVREETAADADVAPFAVVPRMALEACLLQVELRSALLLHTLFYAKEWGW
jgi:hypothetical protein